MADGNIQAAKTRLARAVERMIGPRRLIHYELTLTGPSLYQQLADNLTAVQGDTKTPARSLPPLWIDPTMLLMAIDRQVKRWLSVPGSTPQRLQLLSSAGWRPQDADRVSGMARQVVEWCEQIDGLLNPESRKFIVAACPACGRRTVTKRDSAGDLVRQDALVVVAAAGCTCQACGAHWGPDRYLFLLRLLGFELPEGVLE